MIDETKAFMTDEQKVVVLPRPCTCEGYHIDEAYLEEVPSGRQYNLDECAFAADEVVAALEAAGVAYRIKE